MKTIECAVAWARTLSAQDARPWLVVGKGPSFDRRCEVGLGDYHVLALNHVAGVLCRESIMPFLAHFTDWEACLATLPLLDPERVTLVAPWHPHSDCRVSGIVLDYRIATTPAAAPFRVLSYNSTLAHKLPPRRGLGTVRVRFFSAVAAVNLLGEAGVRDIRLLGIDGGTEYAAPFDAADRLRNGRKSFDEQFAELERAKKRYQLACASVFTD